MTAPPVLLTDVSILWEFRLGRWGQRSLCRLSCLSITFSKVRLAIPWLSLWIRHAIWGSDNCLSEFTRLCLFPPPPKLCGLLNWVGVFTHLWSLRHDAFSGLLCLLVDVWLSVQEGALKSLTVNCMEQQGLQFHWALYMVSSFHSVTRKKYILQNLEKLLWRQTNLSQKSPGESECEV